MRSTLLTALAALAVAVTCAAPAAADVTAADIVGFLNAQRAANGLPAGIVEDPALSAGCLTASRSLRFRGPWTASSNPFEDLPNDLVRLLAPRVGRLGAAMTSPSGCVAVSDAPSRPAPLADVTSTYPGDGAQDWWTQHWADVLRPTDTPGVFSSVRVAVGPVLYAFFDGPGLTPAATAQVTGATLTGPAGPVPVDSTSVTGPTAVEITPRDVLPPHTTYTASVSADVSPQGGGAARAFTKTWSFTTGPMANDATIIHADPEPEGGLRVSVMSASQTASVSATGPGTPVTAAVRFAIAGSPTSPAFATLKLDRFGTWHVCMRSGGPGTDYRLAEPCVDVTAGRDPVPAPSPPASPPKPAVAPLVTFGAGARARLTGRTLAIPLRCAAVCRLSVRGTITAGGRRINVPPTTKRGDTRTTAIHLTLSRALAARVRRAKQRKVALAITARPAAGKVKTYKKTLAIR